MDHSFLLKGHSYTLTTLQLLSADLQALALELKQKVREAPRFFQDTPVVIDLQKILHVSDLDFKQLIQALRDYALVPLGVRGGTGAQQTAALAQGLAVFPETKSEVTSPVSKRASTKANANTQANTQSNNSAAAAQTTPSKVITQPVRSGQQIYAQGGDLVVLAPVSRGAEILADGHIHVYAPLRGRALAGVQGDLNAHIFCYPLEAELISIAGHYKTSEALTEHWGKFVKIALDKEHLQISPL